ncbi:MAG: DUF47 family protein [Elusimicrobiales bacterium]
MQFNLIPKEEQFFDLFDEQAANLVRAAQCLSEAARGGGNCDAVIKKIREIEHEADTVAHEITNMLNRTFITPFDREDILSLANKLDDVVDRMHALVTRLMLYKVSLPDNDLLLFADILEQCAGTIVKAVGALRDSSRNSRIMDYCIELNRLENMGDVLREQVIGRLFENARDAVDIIKRKEIYEIAENAIDECEHAAKLVESIVVKHG